MRSEKNTKKKQTRNRKVFQIVLAVFLLLALAFGGLAGFYGSKLLSFLDGISQPEEEMVDEEEANQLSKHVEDAEPFAALILGTDIEEEGESRTDTIILVTVNPKKESMKLVSIPRDTLVYLPSPHNITEKINAAYSFGGPRLTRDMISNLFDIPIDFYATMDFRGLVELVDAVGGITVHSDFAFTESNFVDYSEPIQIQEGTQTLDGAEALGYARMRKQDPRGDFGRQDRQREVVVALLNELVSFNTVSNLDNILSAVAPYLKTNASPGQMFSIANNYSDALNDVQTLTLDGLAGNEYFPHYELVVWVWEPYPESLTYVSNELQEHLGIVNISEYYDNYPLQNGELEEIPNRDAEDEEPVYPY